MHTVSLAELVGGENVLLLVNVSKGKVEEDGNNGTDNGRAREDPDQMGISNGGRASQVDNVGNGSVEQVDRGHKTTHVDRGTRIGNTVGGDVDEELRETTQGIRNGFPPERYGRDQCLGDVLGASCVGCSVVTARVRLVGLPTEESVANAADGADGEASSHTGNRAVVDLELAKKRVESVLGVTVSKRWL